MGLGWHWVEQRQGGQSVSLNGNPVLSGIAMWLVASGEASIPRPWLLCAGRAGWPETDCDRSCDRSTAEMCESGCLFAWLHREGHRQPGRGPGFEIPQAARPHRFESCPEHRITSRHSRRPLRLHAISSTLFRPSADLHRRSSSFPARHEAPGCAGRATSSCRAHRHRSDAARDR